MKEGAKIWIIPSPAPRMRPGSKNKISPEMSDKIKTQLPTPSPAAQTSDSLCFLISMATSKLPSSALTQIIELTSPRSSLPLLPTPCKTYSAQELKCTHTHKPLWPIRCPRGLPFPLPTATTPAPLPGLTPGPLHLVCPQLPALPPGLCTPD